uniref:Uncharacterized protein n=1 Tax=Arundo donax TaxID=35708 RepID=A0A0A9DN18_ARUDO
MWFLSVSHLPIFYLSGLVTSASRWIQQQLVLDGTNLPCAYLFARDESITLHDLSMNCKSAEEQY